MARVDSVLSRSVGRCSIYGRIWQVRRRPSCQETEETARIKSTARGGGVVRGRCHVESDGVAGSDDVTNSPAAAPAAATTAVCCRRSLSTIDDRGSMHDATICDSAGGRTCRYTTRVRRRRHLTYDSLSSYRKYPADGSVSPSLLYSCCCLVGNASSNISPFFWELPFCFVNLSINELLTRSKLILNEIKLSSASYPEVLRSVLR